MYVDESVHKQFEEQLEDNLARFKVRERIKISLFLCVYHSKNRTALFTVMSEVCKMEQQKGDALFTLY